MSTDDSTVVRGTLIDETFPFGSYTVCRKSLCNRGSDSI